MLDIIKIALGSILGIGCYIVVALSIISALLRKEAKELNLSYEDFKKQPTFKDSNKECYTAGMLWPFFILILPVSLILKLVDVIKNRK